MSGSPLVAAAAAAAVGSAVVGGVFFAFSTFVMRGLDRSGPGSAVAAMRGINDEAQANAPFLALLLGSALVALVVAVAAAARLAQPGSGWLLAGAAIATLPLLVTIAINVPLNNGLAALDVSPLSSADITEVWQDYFRVWTRWNHVRTVAALLSPLLIMVGLRLR